MQAGTDRKRGVVYVTLKEYLARLEALESTKPLEQRRDVPSMAQLARLAGVHPMTISRWVTGETKSTDHHVMSVIIDELQARGFDTDLTDLLTYRRIES